MSHYLHVTKTTSCALVEPLHQWMEEHAQGMVYWQSLLVARSHCHPSFLPLSDPDRQAVVKGLRWDSDRKGSPENCLF